MFRFALVAAASMGLMTAALPAQEEYPKEAREGSIVKVDLEKGQVHVKAGGQDVLVNLKDIRLLRGKERFRLAERRAANKIFVTGDDGKTTELDDFKVGSKIYYIERDGKIADLLLPRRRQ